MLTQAKLPLCVILTGPVSSAELKRMRKLGYRAQARVVRVSWPEGGPVPGVPKFAEGSEAAVMEGENIYLRRSG